MKKAIIFIIILLLVILGLLWYMKEDPSTPLRSAQGKLDQVKIENKLKITFLDIGQGDATFITFPDGQQMLVDCSEDGRILEALGRVMEYYDHDIDYLLITHPDSDHYGGCEEVLNRFEVKNIVYSGYVKDYEDRWNSFWDAINSEGANYFEIDREDVWNISSTTLHFLYPDHSIVEDKNIPGLEKEMNVNNTSIVFEMNYLGTEVLMMGDAEEEVEEYLISTYGDQLDTDILKLGHHGSGSSSMQDFVDIVTPEYSIASCGLNNQFNHPSRRVLKRLERVESQVFRTDLQGDIKMQINNEGIEILE